MQKLTLDRSSLVDFANTCATDMDSALETLTTANKELLNLLQAPDIARDLKEREATLMMTVDGSNAELRKARFELMKATDAHFNELLNKQSIHEQDVQFNRSNIELATQHLLSLRVHMNLVAAIISLGDKP